MNHFNHLLGQSGSLDPVHDGDAEFASIPVQTRPLPTEGTEQAFFYMDIKRSLQLHWRLAGTIALGFVALSMVYVLVQVFVFKSWPMYRAESILYVQPTPAKVLPSEGGQPRWPYDTNTYESYIQQQMMNVSRDDVLIGAAHKIDGFQRPGESDQAAAQRLVGSLEVARPGDSYQFTISARARTPQLAAEIANAVTASYIESASRDERTGDSQRLAMLREEQDRIQRALAADRIEQDELNQQLGVASVGTAVPDHYDEDITQIRTELVKARTDHDAAEQKFAALGAGSGQSSAAIDAAADELISSDAGLVSMKTALNARRATLIAQMANLTPMNPQYKQDEAELAKINSTLEAMMKDLRSKAAARIQQQMRTDLQRTAGIESQLNGQMRQMARAASGATPKLQRSSDLAADITRLQARYATVDEQMHNLMLEDNAPTAAYQVTPAVAPLGRTKSGVMRNALLIAFSGLFFGLLVAVTVHKLDPRVYIASDVEHVLGFAPLAQLPNFNEVSEGVAEEYMLRLASAIEHGRKQGNLRNCIFTGAGSGAGVSTLVTRVSQMLEAMGRPTVLVDATGAPLPAPRLGPGSSGNESAQGLVPVQRASRPTALLQKMAEETETEEESLVLADTAPLLVSAETEYLARFVDCAIVIIESGVTTRTELRNAAATLQRLDVGAVGFVLNRVGLDKADPPFRASIEAVEKHLQTHSNIAARRTERSTSYDPEESAARPATPKQPSVPSMFEPEVAAAAAAVARFSPRAVAENPAAPASSLSTPHGSPSTSEAARRFSFPFAFAAESETEEPVPSPVVAGPASPAPPAKNASPFAEAAQRFVLPMTAEKDLPFSPRPISSPASSAATPNPSPTVPAESVAPVAEVASIPATEPALAQGQESTEPTANQPSDLPWWLSDVPRHTEPPRPPLLWQPAKVSTSKRQPSEAQFVAEEASQNLERQPDSETAAQSWEGAPFLPESPIPSAETASGETESSALQGTQDNRNSRLSSLRNLLYVLGVNNMHSGDELAERHTGAETISDLRRERPTFDRTLHQSPVEAAASMRGASPRLVTAPPEFLPPKPMVIEFDRGDARAGDFSSRQDRRAAADGLEILPSKRGQYKKI
jgi:uncharacterized protein involved in exopolysaccharide biosynthesis